MMILKFEVPILRVSGLADNLHITEAARHGISGFIVKPFDVKTLEAKILASLRAAA